MRDSSKQFKGVYVVDTENSALWRAAQHHCNKESIKLIAANSFRSPLGLAKAIARQKPEFLIFSWREAFDAVIWNSQSRRLLMRRNPLIFLLIPDHLGLDLFVNEEIFRCKLADVILTTSTKLHQAYTHLLPGSQLDLLHDLPDQDLIASSAAKCLPRNKNQIIWIGNSKWGRRQGITDHKGLERFVGRIFASVKAELESASLVVIDSAYGSLKHEHVLDHLAQSSCLLITSNSEGTCLPILEAVALGTPVVTFEVGIAKEIFSGDLERQFIASRDVSNATELALKVLLNFDKASNDSKLAWERYFQYASGDLQKVLSKDFSYSGMWRTSKGIRTSYLKWYFRWIKKRILKLK
jgi:glycosyltransferase involved in cell wall biosynthesis